jgi:hypothetical protein
MFAGSVTFSGSVTSGRFRLAAVAFIAAAIIALTTASGWAFSQQTVVPNGNYNFDYGAADNKSKFGDSTNKSDPNSPGFHLNVERNESPGFRGFGGARAPTPDPYFRTFGN